MAEATRNDGGPAFPVAEMSYLGPATVVEGKRAAAGMSLRDYFAAKAMQAEMITTFSDATPEAADAFSEAATRLGRSVEAHLAFNAYLIADAMLRAREATHG